MEKLDFIPNRLIKTMKIVLVITGVATKWITILIIGLIILSGVQVNIWTISFSLLARNVNDSTTVYILLQFNDAFIKVTYKLQNENF